MNPTRTAAHPLEATRTRKAKRVERHFHSGPYTFDYGHLPEDFDLALLLEENGYYRFSVLVDDRDPNSDEIHSWVLTVPAALLTPRRLARLRPSAEVLFVAHLFSTGYDWFDDDPAPAQVNPDGLLADAVRFAVVNARRRAWTRYARP